MTKLQIDAAVVQQALDELDRGLQFGSVNRATTLLRAALQQPEQQAMVTPYITQEKFDRVFPAEQQAEPCPESRSDEHACKNRHQCWEPCGELGHSEEHAKVREQQAQAGEPEVVAWAIPKTGQFSWASQDTHHWKELITLQSHRDVMDSTWSKIEVLAKRSLDRVQRLCNERKELREAIATKDEALKACVEALKRANDMTHTAATNELIAVAITKAQGAMK